MGYFSQGFVFTKEPNWEAVAQRPVAMQVYQHKTEPLWVLEVSSRSIDKKNPFGAFVLNNTRYNWTHKRELKKLKPKTRQIINRLYELRDQLDSKEKRFDFGVETILVASQIAQLAEAPCYYYCGNDETLDLGVNFLQGEIQSFAFRVCDSPLVVKFKNDKLTILVDKKGLASCAELTFYARLLEAIEKWKSEKDITVKNATKKELELFGFYSIATSQWPRSAGDPKAALGVGTWELYSNLARDYKVVAARKTPVAKMTGKGSSKKSSAKEDAKPVPFEKLVLPKGFFFVGGTSSQLIFSKGGRGNKQGVAGETMVCDLSKWPPKPKTFAKEYVTLADCSRKGTWAFASAALQDRNRGMVFEARIRDSLSQKHRVIETEAHSEYGITQVNLVGDLAVAEPGTSSTKRARKPLVETNGLLKEAQYMPESREFTLSSSIVRLPGGSDVFIWAGKGYEMKRKKLVKTFDLHAEAALGGSAPLSKESFLYAAKGKLYRAQRNKKSSRYFSKASHARRVFPGPSNSAIVQNLDRDGDVAGFLLFPKDNSYIRLEKKLLPKTLHYQPNGLIRWAPECGKIVFITWAIAAMSLWAIDVDDLMQQPRLSST